MTVEEARAAWNDTLGQGNARARERGPLCVVTRCLDETTAAKLTGLFLQHGFNVPSCAHWDGETLSFYVGDAGHGAPLVRATIMGILVGYGAA